MKKNFNMQNEHIEQLVINERTSCSVCNNPGLSEVLDLPKLPFTGRFTKNLTKNFFVGVDQKFLFCNECGHGQLFRQVNPSVLYDKSYSFKTSMSASARTGTGFFLGFLESLKIKHDFQCILDVGCNDLYLLQELKDYGKIKVGIDPIWLTEKSQPPPNFLIIGGTIEGSDLIDELPEKPDLIVCRHTLEHIYDPRSTILKLMASSHDDALFVFEVPCLDSLVNRGRFDQVFHEHLQYFSFKSWEVLLEQCEAEIVGVAQDYHNWGALGVAFRKKRNGGGISLKPHGKVSEKRIHEKMKLFKVQVENTAGIISSCIGDSIYGYGAALMLPVLAYHMKSDFSFVKGIIDDDDEKEGWYYENLPLKILRRSSIKDFNDSSIILTAIDNSKPILTKILTERPRHIICPLNMI